MKTFSNFCAEAYSCEAQEYDADLMAGAQIVRRGVGGRIGRKRKLTAPEVRRQKSIGLGKTKPAKRYKKRKDAGIPKPTSVTVQQPEGERGSSKVAAALMAASKEERKKAALKRIAAKKSGESSTETKPKPRDLIKGASSLLSTKPKAPKPAPGYTPHKPSGYSEKEIKALRKKGERVLRDVVLDATGKKSEKELKHKYTSK